MEVRAFHITLPEYDPQMNFLLQRQTIGHRLYLLLHIYFFQNVDIQNIKCNYNQHSINKDLKTKGHKQSCLIGSGL